MAKVPAFTDIGKAAKELLYGGKEGAFNFNHQVSLTSKTADGVEFTISAVKQNSTVEPAVKIGYKEKNYSLLASFTNNGKVVTTASITELAPGLGVTLTGSIPDQASGKATIDYALPHLTLKSVIGLTNNPKVDLAASTGYQQSVFGGTALYDTALGRVSTWTVGGGYNGLDYQVGVTLTDNEVVKGTYAHNINASTTAGAEVVRALSKEITTFTLGYQKRLEGGALTKVKLDNLGIASILYETELSQPKSKSAVSVQFDATDLSKPAKFGVAIDLKN